MGRQLDTIKWPPKSPRACLGAKNRLPDEEAIKRIRSGRCRRLLEPDRSLRQDGPSHRPVLQVDEVKDIRDKALALEEYARQANNTQAERKAAEIRIRAERKVGKLLAEIERSKGLCTDQAEETSVHDEPRLSETPYQEAKRKANVSDTQAKRWQQLAAMPHGDFEGRLHDPEIDVPTTVGILNADRSKAPPDEILHLWGIILDLERDGYLRR